MNNRIITLFALASMSLANAQDVEKDTTKVTSLDEVVIVASRKATKISDIPSTVWVVPNQKLKTLAATGVPLKEILGQLVPGMDVGSQARTNFSQNMRGRAMLVMIDGVSLNSLRRVSRQLDAIDPFNIERIEVLSGASSVYGGNATGGIINIVTKRPEKDQFSGNTKFSYRSGFMGKEEGDYSVSQSLALKDDKVYARLGVSYQQNGGFYGANKKQIFTDIAQTDLQYNKSIDVLATGGYKFNNKHSLSVTAQYYNSEFNGDRGLFLGENFRADSIPSLLVMKNGFISDNKIGTQRYMGILSYRGQNILGGQDLHIQLSSRAEELRFYPFLSIASIATTNNNTITTAITTTAATEQNTDYKGVKAILSKNIENLEFTYGIDADFEDFESFSHVYDQNKAGKSGGLINQRIATVGRYPDVSSKSYAAYLQAKYKIIPELMINGGVRYQYNDITVRDFIGSTEQVFLALGKAKSAKVIKGGDSSYDVLLWNMGLLLKPNEDNQLWVTFSQGSELADPAKLYGVGKYELDENTKKINLVSGVNINDTELQGIVTNQLELGYRTKLNGLKAQVSGFYAFSDKNIKVKNRKKEGNLYISVEDRKIRNIGFEAEVSYNMDNGFYLGANTLFIKSEIKVKNEWVKQYLYMASPSKVMGYIGYQKDKFFVRFQNQQVFKLKDDNKNEVKAYNLSDLTAGYKLPIGKFSLGVQNIFNTDYQTVWSKKAQMMYSSKISSEAFYYKGRGRTFNISYSLSF